MSPLVRIDYRSSESLPWKVIERGTGRVLGAADDLDGAERIAGMFDLALRRSAAVWS